MPVTMPDTLSTLFAAPTARQETNGQTVKTPGLAWHLQEVEVFGDELGESLTADAPVWLGVKQGTKTAPLETQSDHPASAATDANLHTGFRSLAAREDDCDNFRTLVDSVL